MALDFAGVSENAARDKRVKLPLREPDEVEPLRVAIGRACCDAGVPVFSPHDLRHRRISLLHHQGESWAEIGARVGQRNISTTADTYSHVLMDYRELDRPKLLERARTAHTSMRTPAAETRLTRRHVLGQVRPLRPVHACQIRIPPRVTRAMRAASAHLVLPSVLPSHRGR